MNLLEQYIVEVHSIEDYHADWTEQFGSFVEVDVTSNCYGNEKRGKHIFKVEEWEKYKEQGYWMA